MPKLDLANYEKWIYKNVWHYAQKWGYPIEELLGQAWEIAIEAARRWDPERSSFTHFLFNRMKGLGDFCRREKRIASREVQFLVFDPDRDPHSSNATIEPSADDLFFDRFVETLILVERERLLSTDAVEMLEYIKSYLWYVPGKRRQGAMTSFIRSRGWSRQRYYEVRSEISEWWAGTESEILS